MDEPKNYSHKGHISSYHILLYILPISCTAANMGTLYIFDSFIKWKNVIMELQMLREVTDGMCSILHVHFGYFLILKYYSLYFLYNS